MLKNIITKQLTISTLNSVESQIKQQEVGNTPEWKIYWYRWQKTPNYM